jgi:hypothetical protein
MLFVVLFGVACFLAMLQPALKLALFEFQSFLPGFLAHAYPAVCPLQSLVQGLP